MPFVVDIDPIAFDRFGIAVRWYGIVVEGAALVAVPAVTRRSPAPSRSFRMEVPRS